MNTLDKKQLNEHYNYVLDFGITPLFVVPCRKDKTLCVYLQNAEDVFGYRHIPDQIRYIKKE